MDATKQQLRRRRTGKKVIGIGAITASAAMVATALIVPAASADDKTPTSVSAAHGHGIQVDLAGQPLVGAADAYRQWAASGQTGTPNNGLDVSLFDGKALDIGGVNVPLISTPGAAGLLDLGGLGLLHSFADSPYQSVSTASSGVVGDDGAVALSPADVPAGYAPAKLDLSALIAQLLGPDVSAGILNEATIEIGAVASKASAVHGTATPTTQYLLAGLDAKLQSDLVAGVTTEVNSLLADVLEPVSELLGSGGTVESLVSGVVGTLNALSVPAIGTGVSASIGDLSLDVTPLTTQVQGVLSAPLENSDQSLSIDLSAGVIRVDLQKILMDSGNYTDWNNLPANTELLQGDVVSGILAGVTDALTGPGANSLTTKLTDVITTGIYDVKLNVSINADISVLFLPLVKAPVTVKGTLGDFLGTSGVDPVVDVSKINVAGIPVGAVLQPVTDALNGLVSNLTGALLPVVTGPGGVVDNIPGLVSGLTDPLLRELLDDGLTPVLTQIASIKANEQPASGDFGPNSTTVRAVAVTLLPDVTPSLARIELASSTVKHQFNAPNPGDANTNASASASASAAANGDNEAAAKASAQAAAMADHSSSATATANSEAAAKTAASTTASTTASATSTSSSEASAVGSNDSTADSASGAEGTTKGNSNAGAASEAAAQTDASSNASSDAAANGDSADAQANANVNASASASADSKANAAAKAAALADATSTASAKATTNANSAAKAAANQNASTDASTTSGGSAQAAANAAAHSKANSDSNASVTAASNSNASAAASSSAIATSSSDASATASADANVNASASASAAADGQATAAAKAAATVDADSNSSASAKATANAQAAAKAAATTDSSTTASATAEAAAKASAQAAAYSKADSDSNASGTAKAEGNASVAAQAAANQDASTNASSQASANTNGSDAKTDTGTKADASTNASASSKADTNANASASASADSKANAAAKAAAVADAKTTASAKATASAQAAAQVAANTKASTTASTKANAASKAAAQAAAMANNSSKTNASTTAKANSNASAAAKAAAIANASSDASGNNPNPNTVKCLTPSPKSPFLDTATNHKFYTEIDWMYCMKYTTGIKSDAGLIYGPQMRLSREAMAAFIYRMKADPKWELPAESPFADMKPGDKFYKEIVWMHDQGLSTGIKQDSGKPIYGPKLRLTREAMAAFVYRLESPGNYTAFPPSKMQDMKPGDKFYKEISWMVDEGLSTGIRVENGNREYWPKSKLSREAMAAFIYRLVNDYRG